MFKVAHIVLACLAFSSAGAIAKPLYAMKVPLKNLTVAPAPTNPDGGENPGTGEPPAKPVELLFSPDVLDFGVVQPTLTAKRTVVVVLKDGDPTPLTLDAPSDAAFRVESTTCGAVMQVGQACKADIVYTSASGGLYDAVLPFVTPKGGKKELPLMASTPTPAGALVATVSGAFATPVGSQVMQTVTFRNTGNVSTGVTDMTFTPGNGFSVLSNGCTKGLGLAPNAACSINVIYSPETLDPSSARLQLTGDNPKINPGRIALTGESKTGLPVTWTSGVAGVTYQVEDTVATLAGKTEVWLPLTGSRNAGKWYVELEVSDSMGVLNLCLGDTSGACTVGRYFDYRWGDGKLFGDVNKYGLSPSDTVGPQARRVGIAFDATAREFRVYNASGACNVFQTSKWSRAGTWMSIAASQRKAYDTSPATWTVHAVPKCMPAGYQLLTRN